MMKSITTCIFMTILIFFHKHCILKCIRKKLLNTFENDDFFDLKHEHQTISHCYHNQNIL
jgi:hypothetical protein